MKKILILVMSCKDEFFQEQEKFIDQTWGKDVLEGKYPNIKIMKYHGGEDKNEITSTEMKLHCEDDINNTFKKTYLAFSLAKKYMNYDYIFRVNTSTYVNIDLLNNFVQNLKTDDVLWCAELYSLSESMTPFPLNLFGRGNALLFSSYLIDIILSQGFSYLYFNMTDDNTIGNILNSYWMKNNMNYLDHIKSFRHGWFRCIGSDVITKNTICQWNNSNCSFDFMKNFMTIQIKRYWEREKENQNYIDLYNNCFRDNKDNNIQEAIDLQYEYSKNPNVFIGSILGYISYDKWLEIDKQYLYKTEVNNKSIDDINRGKGKDLIIL